MDKVDGNQGEATKMLSAETISAINNLYEEFKIKSGGNQGAIVDLKDVRSSLEDSNPPVVPLEVFDAFFKQYLEYTMETL